MIKNSPNFILKENTEKESLNKREILLISNHLNTEILDGVKPQYEYCRKL